MKSNQINVQADPMALQSQILSDNWEWKQRPRDTSELDALSAEDGWTTTTAPTEIFKDLLDAGKIKDPHLDLAEKNVQWVGEVDWLYRTRFTVENVPRHTQKVVLRFDGLDTFANVYVNGKWVLSTEV
jgi:beta-mannosidase